MEGVWGGGGGGVGEKGEALLPHFLWRGLRHTTWEAVSQRS